MADPFLGELRLMSFGFAPKGWAQCNGQLLPINQNQALFALFGTTYGGDGRVNFALPDLRGRVPVHRGRRVQGERFGEESHTLSLTELPAHQHGLRASPVAGSQPVPGVLASANHLYGPPVDPVAIHPQTIAMAGGDQPHENRPPYLVLDWCVALQGIFPSRN